MSRVPLDPYGNPVGDVPTPPATIVGGFLDSITDMRLVSVRPKPGQVISTLGYLSPGDGGEGDYRWDNDSTAADDGAMVIATALSQGRFKFIVPSSGAFPVMAGGVKCDGTTGQYTRLREVHISCTESGRVAYLDLGYGTIDIGNGGTTLRPALGSAKAVGLRGRGIGLTVIKGPGHSNVAGNLGMSSVMDESNDASYSAHDFTMDLSSATPGAGTKTFTGVSNASDYSVGNWVYVRLGLDPTDAGLWWGQMLTYITGISGSDVTVAHPVPENIPQLTGGGAGVNVNRQWNHHDMIRVTRVANGFEMSDFSLDNIGLSNNLAINSHCHDFHHIWSTNGCNHVYDFNTVVERCTADTITGVSVPPGTGAYAHYGWYSDGWCHNNYVLRDVRIERLEGVNFFSSEGQGRQLKVDNAFITAAQPSTPRAYFLCYATTQVNLSNITIAGSGGIACDDHATITNLRVLGSDETRTLLFQVNGSQIYGTVEMNGKIYNWIKSSPAMTMPLAASATRRMPMPVNGLVRNIRIRPSSLTGITVFEQTNGPRTYDLLPFLVSGQWTSPGPAKNLSGLFPAGGYADSNVYLNIVTNGSVPAGAYVTVEVEFFVSDASLATNPPQQVVGTGTPSADAEFVGQMFLNTSGHYYQAISVGQGASDWRSLAT